MENSSIRTQIIQLLKSTEREGMDNLIEFMDQNGFFTAPASSKFHCCYPGGLAQHSMNVYNVLKNNVDMYHVDVGSDSVIICSLLHDICKIKDYKMVKKNRKIDGKWNEVMEQERQYDFFPAGHGSKSVIMIQKFIALDSNEILAIYWHMGPFTEGAADYSTETSKHYNEANKKHPFIPMLFISDMTATQIHER